MAIKLIVPTYQPFLTKDGKLDQQWQQFFQQLSAATSQYTGEVIPIDKGGTGATTASAAINALLPDQTGHSTDVLTTNGTIASWEPIPSQPVSTSTSSNQQDFTQLVIDYAQSLQQTQLPQLVQFIQDYVDNQLSGFVQLDFTQQIIDQIKINTTIPFPIIIQWSEMDL